jgi:hypothetical protein
MVATTARIQLVDDETQALMDWAIAVHESDDTYFHKSQQIARRLGAHYRADGMTEIGFWTPRLASEVIQSERDIFLEVFTPLDPIDFRTQEQTVRFQCDRIPLPQQGEFVWGVLSGMQPGQRDRAGSFYWLRALSPHHYLRIIRDPLAYSMPYGVFAPAELYDLESLNKDRADLEYLRQTAVPIDGEVPRVSAPRNILQLHVTTASPTGTLEGLTELYRKISDKIEQGLPLTAAEENFLGYDAVQLLPMEPTIEYRVDGDNFTHEFFAIASNIDSDEPDLTTDLTSERIITDEKPIFEEHEQRVVTLRKPNTHNWGYDVPILGSNTTNPALLGSLRPDAMVDFIATLHTFAAGPIQLIYDLVYGHADNQSEELLNRQFLKGPNMYGQDLNHQLPNVRAILLEMQRRKINTGADGIRVDGGQDFRWFNPLTGRIEQDDAYLLAMSDVVQDISGHQRLMFTIFEDGRPWPQEGWEETSTYRDLIELKPDSYQWGPLIFAHNTPALEGFWDRKWKRVSEVLIQGDHWITGCANHDTVRRGNQIALTEKINWNLGKTLPEVLKNAYDNPSVKLWVYGFSPGLPMDFINSMMWAPWLFFRNTDDRYGVKVAAEEIGFLDWQVEPELYDKPWAFERLKQLGFMDLKGLKTFCIALSEALIKTDYDLEAVARLCQRCLGDNPDYCEVSVMHDLQHPDRAHFLDHVDVQALKNFAMCFMEDAHDLCNIRHYMDTVDPVSTHFGLQVRRYRQDNPWLAQNLGGSDRFNRISDKRRTLFYGLRTQPDVEDENEAKQVALVTHMGGKPTDITLGDWLQLDLSEWRIALATPGLEIDDSDPDELRLFELHDSQGVLLEKIPDSEL